MSGELMSEIVMRDDPSKPVIQAVFLDWAGTVVDHGSIAPVKALEDVFLGAGVHLSHAAIRRYMGLAKKDHVRALIMEPGVTDSWLRTHGKAPSEEDVERLYAQFEPQMMEVIGNYAQVIAGAPEIAAQLRARGIRLAGTTGYTRPMLEAVEKLAAEQGYATDASAAPEDVGAGRPFPWMCYKLAIDLRVFPLSSCVKVGDTESDMLEGRNAGMWTIGVTRSGNGSGLTEQEWAALSFAKKSSMEETLAGELMQAGAHYTAESVAYIQPILAEIEGRILRGERP
jgi:phosphonoacetaldehyde hydrolase